MSQDLTTLSVLAVTIGFLHTLSGPDHYLPFIVMAKARKWSLARTVLITILCGSGHILSSVLLGFIGIAMGIGVGKLGALESFRGNIAGWLLISFGLVYFAYGINRIFRNRPHTHRHFHKQGNHLHKHVHNGEHVHVHGEESSTNITPWILFTIFIFGPCEPLIPLLMYPAAKGNIYGLVLVVVIFGVVTVGTMLTITMVSLRGMNIIPLRRVEKYSHALAGATICLCGIAIQFFGL